MIASIEGLVQDKSLDGVIINVQGIGYEIAVCDRLLISLELNKPAKLFIHEQIKEDAHDLYGFNNKEDKLLFEKLLSVKNVGPRVAMAVMNIGETQNVRQAIAGGDTKLLQTAKEVGRRAAEQIIVELRDKIGLDSSSQAEAIVSRGGELSNDEAVEALVSLGYSSIDASNALAGIDASLPVEERIKHALRSGK